MESNYVPGQGGMPHLDREAARKRMETQVSPYLTSQGFNRINKTRNTFYNPETNTIVLGQSAPTGHSLAGNTRSYIRKLRREYGLGVTIYIHFNRPTEEWVSKPKYRQFLKDYQKIPNLEGIIGGFSNLVLNINNILQNRNSVYCI